MLARLPSIARPNMEEDMNELEVYLERHKGRTLQNTPDHDLLLLSIARLLQALVGLSQEGLKFSQGLASLIDRKSVV